MKYEEPTNPGRGAFASALATGDPESIVEALLGLVAHDPDGHWLQETCLDLLNHEHELVRANAITALGHVARIHGIVDRARAVDRLHECRRGEPALAGRIQDALDDIATFT